SGGWPIQARFWLEWGCSRVTDLVPTYKLDCAHAMGTDTFSAEWAESFHYILLLPPPSIADDRRKLSNLRISFGAVRRSYKLYVYGYVVMPEHVHLMLSEPQTSPLKPKPGLNGPPIQTKL